MQAAALPMPAAKPEYVSRRAALAGLGGMLAAGCGRLSFIAANVPAVFGDYQRHADISYGTNPRQRLDVYVPNKVPVGQPCPLIVFWHGGRWSFGDKADYRFVGAALAGLGYVAVLPNYRHYPEVTMPGFMDDAARAGQWAAVHGSGFGADKNRLYLMGHSAGAHLAALAALDPRYFAATGGPVPSIAGVIGLSGPYDFLPLLEADVQDMFGPPPRYPDSQPINFVRPDAPPMLLVHGLKDDTVWPKNSRNLATALAAQGVPVTLRLYPKLLHADTVAALSLPARGRAPTLADIAAFIRQPRSPSLAPLSGRGAEAAGEPHQAA
jgi:acetyl esterase/lipase